MITLQALEWSNCFSYGPDNCIELNKNPLTQIVGLNGHGKSSIPLILEELFYNKNSKNMKKAAIPNRYLDGTYSISGTFTKDDDTYKISVVRKVTAKVKLEKNGEDISSHTATGTYKTVEQILGLDFKTFSQLIYQSTNASLQFLTATDTSRKKFLIDLLHLEEYTRLFEIFKEAAKNHSVQLVSIDSKIKTIENWLSSNTLVDATLQPLEKIDISTEEDEQQTASLRIELENISQKNKKIEQNNQYIKLLNAINLDEAEAIKATQILPYDHLQSDLGEAKQKATAATSMIKKLEGLGNSCPTCMQDIDTEFKARLLEIEKDIVKSNKQIMQSVEAQIKDIKDNNAQVQKKKKLQKEWEELYKSVDWELPKTLLDRAEIQESLSIVQKRLKEKRDKVDAIMKENDKRSRSNSRIQVIQEQTVQFEKDLAEAQASLNEIQEVQSRLETLKKSFSTNGLLAYKIENLVKELEVLTNDYLADFSDGRFTLEFAVVNDKLNVVIVDNGAEISIETLSSGELARVNTASLLAIRKLMSSISESRLNILFLDEVISTLDDYGKEKLVEVLMKEQGLNTFIVSHGWTHPLLDKLQVVKENNISRIEA